MATFLPVVGVVPVAPPLFGTALFTALFPVAFGGADQPRNGQSQHKWLVTPQ